VYHWAGRRAGGIRTGSGPVAYYGLNGWTKANREKYLASLGTLPKPPATKPPATFPVERGLGQRTFRTHNQHVVCGAVRVPQVRNGKVVYDLNGITRTDWDKLPKNYLQTGDPRWDGIMPQRRTAPVPPRAAK
jgi:hypothetical protein